MAPQPEWFDHDYYKVLGVAQSVSDKEITKAYRQLAKENHPDHNPGREDRFKEINSAYQVLGDAGTRKEYDEVRRLGPGAFGMGRNSGGSGGGPGYNSGDVGDLFANLFGQGAQQGGQRRTRAPRRGDDMETSVAISFADAVAGVVTKVDLFGDGPCLTCDATGSAPGTRPSLCTSCAGRGSIEQNQGFFSFNQPCGTCQGTGMKIDHPCQTCKGSGNDRKRRTVSIRIPSGVENGQRIRLKGKGGLGLNGGQPGDLLVLVEVGRHALFGRKGADLTIVVPVSFAEAVLGAPITVPTLDASVQLRIPPGTKSGRTLRAKGRGAVTKSGTGDLLVTIEVAIPAELTDAQRVAVEAYAAATDAHLLRAHLGV
jgi:molecular chaperone DnaJ